MAEITGRNPNRYKILPGELCAGAELGKDSCYGEGGFPLVCQSEEDKWHAVGIGKYKQNTVKLPLRPAGTKKLEGFLETVLLQGDQDHFLSKEMLLSPSILKLHKNP